MELTKEQEMQRHRDIAIQVVALVDEVHQIQDGIESDIVFIDTDDATDIQNIPPNMEDDLLSGE